MKKCYSLFVGVLFLAGCSTTPTTQTIPEVANPAPATTQSILGIGDVAPLPMMDISTPDRAVKNHWAFEDYKRDTMRRLNIKRDEQIAEALASKGINFSEKANQMYGYPMVKGEIEQSYSIVIPTYSRTILEVKQESDSRAVVLTHIKNITPIPTNLVLDDAKLSEREAGEKYQYITEKDASGWKIVDVLSIPRYQTDWTSEFQNIKDNKIEQPDYEYRWVQY